MTAPHERYRADLESLTPETVAELPDHVTQDVRFKDPFNDVRGVEAMGRVFLHMFENVREVRFVLHHASIEGDVCLLQWTVPRSACKQALGFRWHECSALRDGRPRCRAY